MSATILDAFEYAISQGYAGTQAEFTALMSLALKYEKTTRKDLGRVTAYGYAKSKGYTGTEEEFAELMASYATVAEAAADSASEAEGYAEDSQEWSVESEAWAAGQRNGVDVDSEDETYHNNSKYYAEQAQDSADAAAESAATFTTDTDLTISGKAADAKATGDRLAGIAAAVGSPLVITDPDDFDNASHTRVYVYAGTTTSLYTNGDWYYWDGDGWESGGVYNSVAVDTDDTLSVSGMAADAAAVGEVVDDVTDLKSALNYSVLNGNNILKSDVIYTTNNTAIANNNDGTYTVGTTDYGITIFGKKIRLEPGIYMLFGSPQGTSFVSTDATYQNRFVENGNQDEKTFVITSATDVFVGHRTASSPLESFIISPYLKTSIPHYNKLNKVDKKELYYTKRIYEGWNFGELKNDGTVNSKSTGLRTSFIYLTENATVQVLKAGYKFNLARYASQDFSSFVSGSYKSSSSGNSIFIDTPGYYIISIWHVDNSSFSDTSEGNYVKIFDNSSILNFLAYKQSDCYRSNVRFGNVPSVYYSGLLSDFSASSLTRQTTTSEMYTLFDDLVDGTYMTKKDLGVCSDGVQHIYEYDLIPTQCDLSVSGISYVSDSMPKILITSAQHGFEKGSVFGLYYLINDIINNWSNDPVLDYLRNHVQIKIIPICNPYGFDENSYYNYNGVNLNRNYDTPGFDGTATPGTSSYGGTTPESEAETKAICRFIMNNLDAVFLFDFHTNGQWAVTDQSRINWLDFSPVEDPLFERFKYVAQTHIESLSMHFSNEYNLTENTTVGYVTSGDSGYTADFPSVDCWALTQDLCGHTIEGFCGFPAGSLFTEDVCKANAEIIGNWTISVINYLNNLSD